MTSYRFCRSDDIPLLVDAYNKCYRPHFPEQSELTVDGFKSLIKSHDLWTSSCMVAQEGDDPIAVLFSAKREEKSSLIYCVGVHRDYQRQGHGQHLLTSLSQKLAILGPPLLLAEVEANLEAGRALLQACGYQQQRTCFHYHRRTDSLPPTSPAEDLVVSVTQSELVSQGIQISDRDRPWLRNSAALESLGDAALGLAVVSDVRIEAWMLFSANVSCPVTLLAFGTAQEEHRVPLISLLLTRIEREYNAGIDFLGVSEDEMPAALAEVLGFGRLSEQAFYSAMAIPA